MRKLTATRVLMHWAVHGALKGFTACTHAPWSMIKVSLLVLARYQKPLALDVLRFLHPVVNYNVKPSGFRVTADRVCACLFRSFLNASFNHD